MSNLFKKKYLKIFLIYIFCKIFGVTQGLGCFFEILRFVHEKDFSYKILCSEINISYAASVVFPSDTTIPITAQYFVTKSFKCNMVYVLVLYLGLLGKYIWHRMKIGKVIINIRRNYTSRYTFFVSISKEQINEGWSFMRHSFGISNNIESILRRKEEWGFTLGVFISKHVNIKISAQ